MSLDYKSRFSENDSLVELNKFFKKNQEKTSFSFFEGLIAIIVVVLIWVVSFSYGVISCGFVGMKLWEWFIVPVFHLPLLTTLQAYGISLLAYLWTHDHTYNNMKGLEASEKIGYHIGLILLPWIILFTGYIVHKIQM